MDAAKFAAKLRDLRIAAGLSQAALAAKAGVHQRAISNLEQALNLPTLETAFALADALGIDVNEFRDPGKSSPPGRGRPRHESEPPPEQPRDRGRSKHKPE